MVDVVELDGRRITLSNTGKVLYPAAGLTKGDVLRYYAAVAEVLLVHVADRPMTFRRFPDGVEAAGFFAKNVPRGTPDWVRRVDLPAPGSTLNREMVTYPVVDDAATLLWAANLAALELHVPQWQLAGDGAAMDPDRLVIDLDPGAPATIVQCCEVALLVRDVLAEDGLTAFATTSGSKGMQLYAPIRPTPADAVSRYARRIAARLERERPRLVLSRMDRAARRDKIFLDWSQNNAAKTTIAPYSLRARPMATVATPLGWDEVAVCRAAEELSFVPEEVVDRVAQLGDLMADLAPDADAVRAPLPES
jgi:bifunctional non-homologous end joining protein LigD